MKILHIAAECAPFAKTGGLGDVVGALPKALRKLGHDVRVVLPLYRGIDWNAQEVLPHVLVVPLGGGNRYGGVRRGTLPGSDVPIYFVEHRHYFDRQGLYGYGDDIERFAFLCRAALESCYATGWIPEVVHAHDWHTALATVYLQTVEWLRPLHTAASVFSVHNLAFQGVGDAAALPVTGLGMEHFRGDDLEHFGTLNLMKGAIRRATRVSTVSPTYAAEIQTSAHGFGLDGELRARGAALRGILNGIDVEEWDPARDRMIPERYSAADMWGKSVCKAELQRRAGLHVDRRVPLFGVVARLTRQKGMDVLAAVLRDLLKLDLQVVILGAGDGGLEDALRHVAHERPDRVTVWTRFDEPLAHQIEAGSDFFLMPSRFEPCGLNQLYSLRYGTLPIVRATGGLADTVENYDEGTGAGTGFVLNDLSPGSLWDTVAWAVSTWFDRPAHIAAMRRRAMAVDNSWEHAAKEYQKLYVEAVAARRAG
jgi:starch synthase